MRFVHHREIDVGAAVTWISFLDGGHVALGDVTGGVTFLDPDSGARHSSPPPPEPEFYDVEEQEAVPAGDPLGGPLVTSDGGTAVVLYSLGALVVDLPTGAVRHRLARDEDYAEEEGELAGLPWAGVLDSARDRVAILYAHPGDGVSTLFWDLESGARAGALYGEQLQCVLQNERQWIVADVDGNVTRYDLDAPRPAHAIERAPITARERMFHAVAEPGKELHWEAVTTGMVADSSASRLLTLRRNGAVIVLETATGAVLRKDYTDTAGVWSTPEAGRLLAFSPGGDAFLLPEEATIALVDVGTGDVRRRWEAPAPITRCSFLPAAGLALTVAEERTLQLWTQGQDRPITEWTMDAEMVTWAVSPDGRFVITQSDGRCVVLQLTAYEAPRTIDSLRPPRAHDGLPG
jgi:hypothetical protein